MQEQGLKNLAAYHKKFLKSPYATGAKSSTAQLGMGQKQQQMREQQQGPPLLLLLWAVLGMMQVQAQQQQEGVPRGVWGDRPATSA